MTAIHPPTRATDDPVGRFLAALAAWPLPGAEELEAPRPGGAEDLVARVAAARLTGPLLLAADHGLVALPEPALDRLVRHHEDALRWCLHLEHRLLDIAGRFDEAGITYRVLKGPAVAHLDEADPGLRTFADLDLLVAGPDVDRAVRLLTALGGVRPWAERRPGFDRRFAKSVTVTLPDRVEVDLHRSLCDGVHGFRIPLHELFERSETFELGDRSLPALTDVHRGLHAVYHAVLGSPAPKLMSLRDVADHLGRGSGAREDLIEQARRWRGEAVLATAVRVTLDRLPAALPEWRAWLARTPIPPGEQAMVDRQRREGSSIGLGKVAALGELSWRDRAAYGLALAVPTRAHLRTRAARRHPSR